MERKTNPIEFNHLLSRAKIDHMKNITPRESVSGGNSASNRGNGVHGWLSPQPSQKTSLAFYDSRD